MLKEIESAAVIAQTFILAFGVYSLVLTQRQIQGSTIQATFQTTKDLTVKALEDRDLQPLAFDTSKLSRSAGKRKTFLTLLVNHYYTIYRQHELKSLPEEYWVDVERDAKSFFRAFVPKDRWDSIKHAYAPDFQGFVDSLYKSTPDA